MTELINTTMRRSDLFEPDAEPIVAGLNELISTLYDRGIHMTSWYGTFPGSSGEAPLRKLLNRLLGKGTGVGMDNRGKDYEPLPGAADDDRIPWYLYWEIVQVLLRGPKIGAGSKVLDAGGTGSLFTCYLASLGCEVHSIDLNEKLVTIGNRISAGMDWNMRSYAMDMGAIDFPDQSFDHAYSICVFEHLDYDVKQAALRDIARILKPGGVLSITFDYRNPAPYLHASGPDTSERNRLSTAEDVERNFLSTGLFELPGDEPFRDNGESYLVHPGFNNTPYTFGSIFLRKI